MLSEKNITFLLFDTDEREITLGMNNEIEELPITVVVMLYDNEILCVYKSVAEMIPGVVSVNTTFDTDKEKVTEIKNKILKVVPNNWDLLMNFNDKNIPWGWENLEDCVSFYIEDLNIMYDVEAENWWDMHPSFLLWFCSTIKEGNKVEGGIEESQASFLCESSKYRIFYLSSKQNNAPEVPDKIKEVFGC